MRTRDPAINNAQNIPELCRRSCVPSYLAVGRSREEGGDYSERREVEQEGRRAKRVPEFELTSLLSFLL
jgi:hypothetical protein